MTDKIELKCKCGTTWTVARIPFLAGMKRGRVPACPGCGKVAK